jgi:hypothetical protein
MKSAPTNDASGGPSDSNEAAAQPDLPFLVTHWLANYGGTRQVTDPQTQEAMDIIRKATSEIASAFASMGSFGTSIRVSTKRDFIYHVDK